MINAYNLSNCVQRCPIAVIKVFFYLMYALNINDLVYSKIFLSEN